MLTSHLPISILLMLVVLGDVILFTLPGLDPGYSALPTSCASEVPLTAHGEDVVLGRHHQWLETPAHFGGSGLSFWQVYPRRIVDMRTGRGYSWGVGDVDRGDAVIRFDVPTRWTLFHPGWDRDPWVLFYDCQLPVARS